MEIRRGDPLEPGDADGRSAEQRLKPKFGPKKKTDTATPKVRQTAISVMQTTQRDTVVTALVKVSEAKWWVK